MGLDMYFEAKKGSKCRIFGSWSGERVDNTHYPKDLSALGDYIMDRNFKSSSTETYYQIGYFRKFNALHNYIVEHFADGVDDCKRIYLSRENIETLHSICKTVSEDNSKAEELLPTASGFFFGSTQYDSYYFNDVKDAVVLFSTILGTLDFNKYDVIYQASW